MQPPPLMPTDRLILLSLPSHASGTRLHRAAIRFPSPSPVSRRNKMHEEDSESKRLTLTEKMPSKFVNLRDVSELLLKFMPGTREQLRITFNVPDVLITGKRNISSQVNTH